MDFGNRTASKKRTLIIGASEGLRTLAESQLVPYTIRQGERRAELFEEEGASA